MRRGGRLLIAGVLAAGVASAGLAQAPHPAFAVLDTDGDGMVSLPEIEATAAERFRRADTDGNGGLDRGEIAAMAVGRAVEADGARIGRIVGRFDRNGDGLIHPGEMPVETGLAERLFGRVDGNGDGWIDAVEFAAIQARMAGRMQKNRQGATGTPADGWSGMRLPG